mmetsp:Transcript_22820/g.73441  ORF Transcript_22820/g.73441 Transcript_22820/m.73441 type:complete len:365 (-) Transcript_22820:26-1120(-)
MSFVHSAAFLWLVLAVPFWCFYIISVPFTLLAPLIGEKPLFWFIGLWFDQISFLFVTICGTRLRFFVPASYTRDQVRQLLRPGSQQLVIANHRTEIDWFYFWPLAARWGGQSMVRIMLKSELRHAPGPGWAMQLHRFPFVFRDWVKDEHGLREFLSFFHQSRLPLWMFMFPEGTALYPPALAKSQAFARKNGLPVYKYVLNPRVRGFTHCARLMREEGQLEAVVDATIGFTQMARGGPRPTPMHLLKGQFPGDVAILLERHDVAAMPASEEGLDKWVNDRFDAKESTLSGFFADKGAAFPGSRLVAEEELPVSAAAARARGAGAFALFSALTAGCMAACVLTSWFLPYVLVVSAVMVGRSVLGK